MIVVKLEQLRDVVWEHRDDPESTVVGARSISLSVPGTSLVGLRFYTQFLLFEPQAPYLTASDAVMTRLGGLRAL